MADLGKNGYQGTGYTEPFITSIPITLNTKLDSLDYDGLGVGIVSIDNTEWKNSGLFLRVDTGVIAGTTFTANFVNFDTRMDTGFTGIGRFVITDGSNVATVTSIYRNNKTGVYDITVDSNLTVTDGQSCPVVGRKPDIGADSVISASRNYIAGEKVLESYALEA